MGGCMRVLGLQVVVGPVVTTPPNRNAILVSELACFSKGPGHLSSQAPPTRPHAFWQPGRIIPSHTRVWRGRTVNGGGIRLVWGQSLALGGIREAVMDSLDGAGGRSDKGLVERVVWAALGVGSMG